MQLREKKIVDLTVRSTAMKVNCQLEIPFQSVALEMTTTAAPSVTFTEIKMDAKEKQQLHITM